MRTSRPAFSRQLWVVIHRWAGLTTALFLIVAGGTGSLLAFNDELILASRPSLSSARPPSPGARPLDGVTLAERVEHEVAGRVGLVYLDVPHDHVVRLPLQALPGRPSLGYDEVWADPYTGAIRLRNRVGVLADGPQNIMPFLYSLHYGAILGEWGQWAFGLAALVWTLDCFVGFYLTLPVRNPGRSHLRRRAASWWRGWLPAWRVRWRARGYKLNFDLHRAGGLWLLPMLLVFAWSSVGFNLPSVYRPVMRSLGAAPDFARKDLPKPLDDPPLTLRAAETRGAYLMARRAKRHRFTVEAPFALIYYPTLGLYRYMARTSLDIASRDGLTTVWLDARDGGDKGFEQPTGRTTANTVSEWLSDLHMGLVGGLPYRMFVSALGLVVVILSVTGILVWMRKRTARLLTTSGRLERDSRKLLIPAG